MRRWWNCFCRWVTRENRRLLVLLILCAVLLSLVGLRAEQRNEIMKDMAAQIEIAAAQRCVIETDQKMEAESGLIRPEAEAASRVVFGMAQYLSPDAWRALTCCIINRAEHPYLFENDIIGVCKEQDKWMRYNDDNPVLQEIYDVVYEVLRNWHDGGHRIMSPDYIYVSWSENELVFRDEFIETPNTHYWRVS